MSSSSGRSACSAPPAPRASRASARSSSPACRRPRRAREPPAPRCPAQRTALQAAAAAHPARRLRLKRAAQVEQVDHALQPLLAHHARQRLLLRAPRPAPRVRRARTRCAAARRVWRGEHRRAPLPREDPRRGVKEQRLHHLQRGREARARRTLPRGHVVEHAADARKGLVDPRHARSDCLPRRCVAFTQRYGRFFVRSSATTTAG